MCWEENILECLKGFPCSFELVHLKDLVLRRKRYEACIQNGQEENFDTAFETIRNKNFLTLLLYKLDRSQEAYGRNKQALEIDPVNIVSLANKVFLCKIFEDEVEALETLAKLSELKLRSDFNKLILKARGEIAYTYTRIGPRYYPKAIKLFHEIVDCHKDEHLLKFGLALTYRRCLNQSVFSKEPIEDVGEAVSNAIRLLYEIIQGTCEEELRGKSYCLLGELFHIIHNCVFPLNPDIVKTLTVEKRIDICACYVRAYEAAPNNWFVLARAGKFFRKDRDYHRAEEILLKAIEKRPRSTYAFYHLGLVYKEKAASGFESTFVQNINLAEKNLQQSLKLSNESNTKAVYELGLVYILKGQETRAEEQFRKLVEKGQPYASPLEKANAYEQLGLFYQEKSTNPEVPEEERRKYLNKCKMMLTKSIEEASKAVASVPGIETPKFLESWKSLPTLKELLFSSQDDKDKIGGMKEVARLLTLMRKYKSSLEIYSKIPGSCDVDVLEGQITNYVRLKDFDNALLMLNLLRSTQDQYLHGRRRHFDSTVFLDSGFHFLQTGRMQDAKDCFKMTFRNTFPGSELKYHVFILDDDEDPACTPLQNLLLHCGLVVTRNEQSASTGPQHFRQDDVMLDSTTFLIVVNEKTLSSEMELRCGAALDIWSHDRDNRNIVVLKSHGIAVPCTLNSFKCFEYSSESINNENIQWIRSLFHALLKFE